MSITAREIKCAIQHANVYVYEDLAEERKFATSAGKEIGAFAPVVGNYPNIRHLENLSDICHGILCDVMNGDEPEGLAIALNALANNIPCVLVTSGNSETEVAHLPAYVMHTLKHLEKLGVKILYGYISDKRENGKRWMESYQILSEMIYEKWLAEDSEMGQTVRQFHKIHGM